MKIEHTLKTLQNLLIKRAKQTPTPNRTELCASATADHVLAVRTALKAGFFPSPCEIRDVDGVLEEVCF